MERVVSTTEALVRLGEWIRRVAEEGETNIVERSEKPAVALISGEELRICCWKKR